MLCTLSERSIILYVIHVSDALYKQTRTLCFLQYCIFACMFCDMWEKWGMNPLWSYPSVRPKNCQIILLSICVCYLFISDIVCAITHLRLECTLSDGIECNSIKKYIFEFFLQGIDNPISYSKLTFSQIFSRILYC